MATFKLAAPIAVGGDGAFAATANLRIDHAETLRTNLKGWVLRKTSASAQVRCTATGAVTSGALRVPLALNLRVNGTLDGAKPASFDASPTYRNGTLHVSMDMHGGRSRLSFVSSC